MQQPIEALSRGMKVHSLHMHPKVICFLLSFPFLPSQKHLIRSKESTKRASDLLWKTKTRSHSRTKLWSLPVCAIYSLYYNLLSTYTKSPPQIHPFRIPGSKSQREKKVQPSNTHSHTCLPCKIHEPLSWLLVEGIELYNPIDQHSISNSVRDGVDVGILSYY